MRGPASGSARSAGPGGQSQEPVRPVFKCWEVAVGHSRARRAASVFTPRVLNRWTSPHKEGEYGCDREVAAMRGSGPAHSL